MAQDVPTSMVSEVTTTLIGVSSELGASSELGVSSENVISSLTSWPSAEITLMKEGVGLGAIVKRRPTPSFA